MTASNPNDEKPSTEEEPTVVDLRSATGSGGAVWSLAHGGDLDANLVRLDADAVVGSHVNDEVDVLMVVQAGGGQMIIEGVANQVGPDHLLLVPRGTSREVTAGADGITYLSVHRRRSPMGIGKRPPVE